MRNNNCQISESFILSGMTQSNDLLCYGTENLKIEDFYSLANQNIFSVLLELYKEGTTPGVSKVVMTLAAKFSIDSMGGSAEVMKIISQYVSDPYDMEHYVGIVKGWSLFRKLEKLESIFKLELDKENKVRSSYILDRMKRLLSEIEDITNGPVGIDFREESKKTIAELESIIAESRAMPEKVQLGIKDLDFLLGGLGGNRLVTLAARPGVGKTALALNMAVSMAKRKKSVYFVSLEMSYQELEYRLFSQLSGIEQSKIQSAKLSLEEIKKLSESIESVDRGMLIVNDSSSITIENICSQVKRAKEMFDISCVFIDYLQLIAPSSKAEYRYLEIAQTTRLLKSLSKTLDIPVICLAQLSRKVEERTCHKPLLSDLKESGAIEQDSDIVLAMERRDAYDEFDRTGEAQVYILKNRHGPTGEVSLEFDKVHSKFKDIPRTGF